VHLGGETPAPSPQTALERAKSEAVGLFATNNQGLNFGKRKVVRSGRNPPK
jgi:hypothetical protein